jgi:hypothetical protein
VPSVAQIADERFEFFTKKILQQYRDAIMSHVLIYIPSYFDYVRLRNYFRREGLSFVQICEYSKVRDSMNNYPNAKITVFWDVMERRHIILNHYPLLPHHMVSHPERSKKLSL